MVYVIVPSPRLVITDGTEALLEACASSGLVLEYVGPTEGYRWIMKPPATG